MDKRDKAASPTTTPTNHNGTRPVVPVFDMKLTFVFKLKIGKGVFFFFMFVSSMQRNHGIGCVLGSFGILGFSLFFCYQRTWFGSVCFFYKLVQPFRSKDVKHEIDDLVCLFQPPEKSAKKRFCTRLDLTRLDSTRLA